jgi:hypothetical protein
VRAAQGAGVDEGQQRQPHPHEGDGRVGGHPSRVLGGQGQKRLQQQAIHAQFQAERVLHQHRGAPQAARGAQAAGPRTRSRTKADVQQQSQTGDRQAQCRVELHGRRPRQHLHHRAQAQSPAQHDRRAQRDRKRRGAERDAVTLSSNGGDAIHGLRRTQENTIK